MYFAPLAETQKFVERREDGGMEEEAETGTGVNNPPPIKEEGDTQQH